MEEPTICHTCGHSVPARLTRCFYCGAPIPEVPEPSTVEMPEPAEEPRRHIDPTPLARQPIDPYAPPGSEGELAVVPSRAGLILGLGITAVALIEVLPPLGMVIGAVAWRLGTVDAQRMVAGQMSTEDAAYGKTRAGTIMGKVAAFVGIPATFVVLYQISDILKSLKLD